MQEAFINISDIPTHVMTWGKWIEESFNSKEVVICITGNPGLIGFYTKFMSCISDTVGHEIPVWIVGHTGHDEPLSSSLRKVPLLAGNEQKYTLEAQVQHKIEFIKKYVPNDCKIHLIGHSIGAWIIIKLLQEPEIQQKVQHSYLLFPTIERMAISNNGRTFTKFIQPFWFLIRYIFIIFSMLPSVIRTMIMSMIFFILSIPKYFIGTGLKYANLLILDKIVFMACEEMKYVADLSSTDITTIEKNKEIMKFHYGSTDGWVPIKYMHELCEKIPDLDAELDGNNIDHAFVLHGSEVMGRKVGEWILKYKRIHSSSN